MRVIITIHPSVHADFDAFHSQIAAKCPGVDLSALEQREIQDLKELLARSAGRPPGAYPLFGDLWEIEFISGRVWVRYSREAGSGLKRWATRLLSYFGWEGEVRIAILSWQRFPAARRGIAPR